MDFPVICTSAELDSSYRTLVFPNGDVDKNTLVSLIDEADRRNYANSQLVVFGVVIRDPTLDWSKVKYPDDSCYILVPHTASLGELRSRTFLRKY